MNQKEINRVVLKRLDKLESAVFVHKQNIDKSRKKKSLPNLLLDFRDKNFFGEPKSVKEALKRISPIYSCKIDRVDMALRRLKERKQLRVADKIENGKKVVAYVW